MTLQATAPPTAIQQASSANAPLRVAVVGAGHRSTQYVSYALKHPEKMKLVAVADPDDRRAKELLTTHGLDMSARFHSYEDLAEHQDEIDAVINGTMDKLHFDSTMMLLNAGFDVLLEKPIAPSEKEVRTLVAEAQRLNRTVMICHVLRYAPFYDRIKQKIAEGTIGKILTLNTSEHVSYHHMVTSFVRGKWGNLAEGGNPIMMAKCCHDLDLLAWFMEGTAPEKVSSFGQLSFFTRDNAPQNSTERCMDCPVEPTCAYSAKKLYVDRKLWGPYAWGDLKGIDLPLTDEQKLESLRTTNPLGRCAWKCDNDVMDHQSVLVEFANGAIATHDLVGTSARATRKIHITGTLGEIEGDLTSGKIQVRVCDPTREDYFSQEDLSLDTDKEDLAGHGGGDLRLAADFATAINRKKQSSDYVPRTLLDTSLNGHVIAFAADTSMREGKTIKMG